MKQNISRKSLVFGIVILFFILSVSSTMSTINEYKEKIIDQYRDNYSNEINLLDDDYVIGYWKFDEGNGDIAYDSSGHGYNGTIYGATWTNGHSGYALDFDGVNDYVTLDSYAAGLGFNKSDDLIFSFYINTTSTETGTIYSMSNVYGTYPNFDVKFNYTGSIVFRLYVGDYCGYTVTTNGTYNDGEWHYVEIYYSGITTYPTTKIFVDYELEAEVTGWICHWDYDAISKIKMGRNSNDPTVFFEGKIDEFKIVKYPGGNEQDPPDISGPVEGDLFEEYEFSFITDDPEGDDIWLYIEWGDGEIEDWIGPYESGEEVILTHEWSEEGLYKIKAISKDIWNDGPPSYHTIRIGNQHPDAPIITGPQIGEIDEILEYTFVTYDYEENEIELYIDWDDGQVEEWIGPYGSGDEVKITHSWMEKDIYEIKAKARDELGEGNWSEPYEVVIGNKPPDAPSITGPGRGKPGVEYTFKFLSTDPDGDNIYYWILWGDGNIIEDFGPYASGTEAELSHIWDSKGNYIIEAWARDEYGAVGEKSTLKMAIPKNKAISLNFNQVSWLFEQYPWMFPLLKQLLGL